MSGDATQWHVHKEPAPDGPTRLRDCVECMALNAVAENAGAEVERLRAGLQEIAEQLAALREQG